MPAAPGTSVPDLLQQLHEDYVQQVNVAVAEGREDLAWSLADEYVEDALLVMTTVTDGR